MNKIVLGKSTLPNLKNIKSKVGSMINSNYKVPEDFQNFAPKHNSDTKSLSLSSLVGGR